MNKAVVLKYLRTVHSWLGVIVLPWVVAIGLTGFYLNHAGAVLGVLDGEPFDEASLTTWPGAGEIDQAAAEAIATQIWPDEEILLKTLVDYHGFLSFQFDKPSGPIIVARDTGHYYVKTNYTRTTYAPGGEQVHKKIYWSRIFKEFHEQGWLGENSSRWLADATALAMVVFGLTGIFLWWMPRSRRIRRAIGLGT